MLQVNGINKRFRSERLWALFSLNCDHVIWLSQFDSQMTKFNTNQLHVAATEFNFQFLFCLSPVHVQLYNNQLLKIVVKKSKHIFCTLPCENIAISSNLVHLQWNALFQKQIWKDSRNEWTVNYSTNKMRYIGIE